MAQTHRDPEEIHAEFETLVNMTAGTLDKWLGTEESQAVGWKGTDGKGSGESVGHRSGEKIVEILRKKKADLDEDDTSHMAKVVGYIKRHLAQRPQGEDVAHTNWTYSLKNWGHDPTEE